MAGRVARSVASSPPRRACKGNRRSKVPGTRQPAPRQSSCRRSRMPEAFIELGARQEHVGPAPSQAVQAECAAIMRQDEQPNEDVLAEAVEMRADRGRGGCPHRLETKMTTESDHLIHLVDRSERRVRTHAPHSVEIVPRQKRRQLSQGMSQHAIELPRPLEGCPYPAILRHPLVPEMKLDDLFARR